MTFLSGIQASRRHLLASIAAGGALGLAATHGAPTFAQTPAATPAADDLTIVAAQLRYVHIEKIYDYLPGMQDEAILAAIFGVDVETYRAARQTFADTVHATAMELLADPAFAAQVDALPFQPGDIVVAIGESDSDDLLSAFEILTHLVSMQRPGDGIEFRNLAISGQATSEAIGRFPAIVAQHQPDWVICGLGGNDTLRNGAGATKPRVSIEETALNLAELRRLATAQSATGFVFLTRWQFDPERVAAFPIFQEQQIRILPEDWAAVNDAIRQQDGPVIDLEPLFGTPPGAGYLEPDGLHPTLDGQVEIVRAVVAGLTDGQGG